MVDWAVPVEAPPTERRIQCSKSSRVGPSNFPAASLKADGEVLAKDNSWAIVWDVTEAAIGCDGVVFARRSDIVGRNTPSSRGPSKFINQRYSYQKRCWGGLRCSSVADVNRAANAFHTSLIAAAWDSDILPSWINGAILAMNSMSPGMSSLAHCRRIGLPEVDERISVFVQCAAVSEV